MSTIEDDHLDKLHVPTAPNDIVEPDFILPAKFHPKKPVPLGRRQLLPIGDGHALQYLLSAFSHCVARRGCIFTTFLRTSLASDRFRSTF